MSNGSSENIRIQNTFCIRTELSPSAVIAACANPRKVPNLDEGHKMTKHFLTRMEKTCCKTGSLGLRTSLCTQTRPMCASVDQSQLLKQRLTTSSSNQEAVGLIAQHMVTTCEDRQITGWRGRGSVRQTSLCSEPSSFWNAQRSFT